MVQLKSRMETCRDTLTEAANWNKLVRDVNVKFASGELTQLADQLQALKHSQQILESMPGVGACLSSTRRCHMFGSKVCDHCCGSLGGVPRLRSECTRWSTWRSSWASCSSPGCSTPFRTRPSPRCRQDQGPHCHARIEKTRA